jgi:hypothetical protein
VRTRQSTRLASSASFCSASGCRTLERHFHSNAHAHARRRGPRAKRAAPSHCYSLGVRIPFPSSLPALSRSAKIRLNGPPPSTSPRTGAGMTYDLAAIRRLFLLFFVSVYPYLIPSRPCGDRCSRKTVSRSVPSLQSKLVRSIIATLMINHPDCLKSTYINPHGYLIAHNSHLRCFLCVFGYISMLMQPSLPSPRAQPVKHGR